MGRAWVRCPVVRTVLEPDSDSRIRSDNKSKEILYGNWHALVSDVPDAGKTGKNLGYTEAIEDGEEDGISMVKCIAFGDDLSGLSDYPEIVILEPL